MYEVKNSPNLGYPTSLMRWMQGQSAPVAQYLMLVRTRVPLAEPFRFAFLYTPLHSFEHVQAYESLTMRSMSLRPSGGSRAPFVMPAAPAASPAPPVKSQPEAKAPALRPVVARPSGSTRTLIAQSPASISSPRLSVRPKAAKAGVSGTISTSPSSSNDSQKRVVITGALFPRPHDSRMHRNKQQK